MCLTLMSLFQMLHNMSAGYRTVGETDGVKRWRMIVPSQMEDVARRIACEGDLKSMDHATEECVVRQ
jgi:hypothetical protein